MSTSRYLRLVVAVASLWCATGAHAEEYLLNFDPGSSKLPDLRSDSGRVIAQVLSLVRDYGGTHGIQFVLLGELPADCVDDLKCEDAGILRKRVAAVYEYVDAQSGLSDAAQKLRWQPVARTTPHIEGLRIGVRSFLSQTFTPHCPYQVQVSDPQLPKSLVKDKADEDWVTVIGPDPVPVTNQSTIRIRSPAAQAAQVEVSAKQLTKDGQAVLGTGSDQLQWSATQFEWDGDRAEVGVTAAQVSRDIGDEIRPWDTNGGSLSPPASELSGCRISFSLLARNN